jgi:sn-glycerol 3-phosphate transport system ATP-binding protein
MASLSLRNIIKRYGHGPKANQVIHGVNAEVKDGEFVVIVGPSGCGKSTLLRMVAGLEEISGGELRIGDRVVNNLEPAQRDIAMVFQNYALYPHMTNFDNMAYGLKIAKVPKDEIKARVDKAAKILELGHLLERKPRELSGGQRQRVAIARAIATKPDLIVLDEAVSALDVSVRGKILNLLVDLQREQGIAYIFVSHDLAVVRAISHHIAIMDAGRIAEHGPARDVVANPQSATGRALVAAVPRLLHA